MTNESESPAGQGGASQPNASPSTNSKNSPEQPINQGNQDESPPAPATVEAETAALLKVLSSCFSGHLSLPKGASIVLATWVLSTHSIDAFDVSPRLALISPVPGCGKTTALSILNHMVANPLPTSNASPAAIYRYLNLGGRTVLIDEADSFMDGKSDLAGIINAGHGREMGYVLRVDTEKGFAPNHYRTWCAMAIARIGRMPPALESRSIIVEMQRARRDEGIRKVTDPDRARFEALGKRATAWAASACATLRRAEPSMPKGFANRDADNWTPLFAIADLAGGAWPQGIRDAAIGIRGETEPDSSETLLCSVRAAFAKANTDKLSSEDLCRLVREQDEDSFYSQGSLAAALRPFGIRPRTIRIGSRTPKGYELKQFKDTFDRYLP
jgi:hypothetical protein